MNSVLYSILIVGLMIVMFICGYLAGVLSTISSRINSRNKLNRIVPQISNLRLKRYIERAKLGVPPPKEIADYVYKFVPEVEQK